MTQEMKIGHDLENLVDIRFYVINFNNDSNLGIIFIKNKRAALRLLPWNI
jgi:hypothetical protein